ncbi:MAG: hypothetical protein ABSH50_27220 [Bryobacteraceae bacterium]
MSICGLCSLPLPSLGQAGLNLTGASNCTQADFDSDVQFLNGPGDYFAVVVEKRNISSHPCVFDGPMYGPTFYPDRVPGNPPFALCYDCENRLPNGQSPPNPPLTLELGQVARQAFRWRTTPPNETVRCLQPGWMSGPILLVAPSLLKRICSDIDVGRFSLAADGERIPGFELTSDRTKYYEGERFSVRVTPIRPGTGAPPNAESCPTLYLRERSPDGTTRIDEVQPLAFKGCRNRALGHNPGDWQSGFELDSGANSRWMGPGEHALEVLQLMGSRDDALIRFASSNILRIQLADPSAIPRKWGPRVNGVAADITLDKETFRLGEDVPLHLAVENFDAEVPVYSWDPLWDPCMVVGLEVHDASGNPLPVNERFPSWSVCMVHGFGPRPYAKGIVVTLERTLGGEGWLPNHGGTYTVVVTWAPWAAANAKALPPRPAEEDLKPYAVVRAEATIHVVNGNASRSK